MITSQLKKNPIVYVDFDASFLPNPVTGDLAIITNEDSIKQSIRNLVLTNFYERCFQPTVGGNVLGSLYELLTPALELNLKKNIENTINNFEPRASLISVDLYFDPDENGYMVNIVFVCVSNPNPVSFNVSVNRVY
jgi:phage baseplate assembly protein W